MRKALALAVSTFVFAGFSALAQEGQPPAPPAEQAPAKKEAPAKKDAAAKKEGKKKHK